jgi:hypothetical protein
MNKADEHDVALFDPFTAKLLSGISSCVLSLSWSLVLKVINGIQDKPQLKSSQDLMNFVDGI